MPSPFSRETLESMVGRRARHRVDGGGVRGIDAGGVSGLCRPRLWAVVAGDENAIADAAPGSSSAT